MDVKAVFVESLITVECKESRKVATNILEILDGESLEFLQGAEKALLQYLKSRCEQETTS